MKWLFQNINDLKLLNITTMHKDHVGMYNNIFIVQVNRINKYMINTGENLLKIEHFFNLFIMSFVKN